MEAISIKLPEDIIRTIKEIEETEQMDKATAVRKLLAKAIEKWKKAIEKWKEERAIQLYRDGKETLWRAAGMANLSLREMMKLVAEKGIEMQYTEKDLEEDINAALKE